MGADVENQTFLSVAPPEGSKPRRDCLLAYSRFLNTTTGICCLLCVVAHGLAIWLAAPRRELAAVEPQVLRLYACGLGLLLVVAETEWTWFLDHFRFMESWVCRGLCHSFFSLLTLELTTARETLVGDSDKHKSLALYRVVASCSLLGCAGLYIIGGILCVGRLTKARTQRETQRMRLYDEMQALETKRKELQGLLAVYSNE